MATLVKNHSRFYVQFYDPERLPSRKRVALGTTDRRQAVKMQRRLETAYLDNAFDPWRDDPRTLDRLDTAGITLTEALDRFIEWKAQTGRAKNTLRAYRDAVGLFAARVGEETPLKALTPADVEAFVQDATVGPTTQGFRFQHVRTVLRWAKKTGLSSRDATENVEPPRKAERRPKAVSEAEMLSVCDALRTIYGELLASGGCRAGEVVWRVALFKFAFYTGMRSSELARLRWADVDRERRVVNINRQKNRRVQTVPLAGKAVAVLDTLTTGDASGYVFGCPKAVQSEDRDTRAFVCGNSVAFKAARERAGIERRVTFHSLRHGFVTTLAEAGLSAVLIKEAARHADVSTTMIYVSLANETLKAELDAVFG